MHASLIMDSEKILVDLGYITNNHNSLSLTTDVVKNNMVHIVDVKAILPPTPKTLEEAKGVVTADYQTYLEKTWLQSLHDKYSVNVNNDVLESMWK